MSKLSNEEINGVVVQSLALSTKLIENFEIMEENKLFALKAKQSLKQAKGFLDVYVTKVFDVKDADEDTTLHMKKGASVVSDLIQRIDKSLTTDNILTISERRDVLDKILNNTILSNYQQEVLSNAIIESGILNY